MTPATADLHALSFDDIYMFWTIISVIVLGLFAFLAAPNDLLSIAKYIGLATAVAPFVATWLSLASWLVIQVA